MIYRACPKDLSTSLAAEFCPPKFEYDHRQHKARVQTAARERQGAWIFAWARFLRLHQAWARFDAARKTTPHTRLRLRLMLRRRPAGRERSF